MKRVVIVGSGGSGKSHLSRALGQRLEIPVTHLDAVYFDEHWNPLPKNEFARAQEQLVAAPEWIIDGNHNSTLPIRLREADTVVLMDVSTVAALWGAVSRQIRHGAGQHGNGIHNRLNWAVIRYIATYRKQMRPKVLDNIRRHAAEGAEVVRLRNRRQTRTWLRQLDASR
ncbi:P-loop NTPase family protein [Glycomyces dulcitolivorans]|uniref:topology modulation protein n=1 Tax=Glycomyces dulcitolivorans TaxID=2200759 RepID=UPI000DD2CA7A|nr:topology modulation protein [Glycomyces dulcitolivorans]